MKREDISEDALIRLAAKHRNDPEWYRNEETGEIEWESYKKDHPFMWYGAQIFGRILLAPVLLLLWAIWLLFCLFMRLTAARASAEDGVGCSTLRTAEPSR